MRRQYTEVGKEFNDISIRSRLDKAIDNVEWCKVPCKMGDISGHDISETIKEFRIPKVTHVAVSPALAPYGLYGIRGHYTNGMAEIFAVTNGCEVIPVAINFYPKEESTNREKL